MAPTPTLEALLDALRVDAMGGDVGRLSQVCLSEAEQYQGEAKERLITAGTALAWAAQVLAAMKGAEIMPDTSGIA